jgi:hypothetical protein
MSSFWMNLTMRSLNFLMDSVYLTSWLLELLLGWFLRLTFMRKLVRLCSSSLSYSYCEWVLDYRNYYFTISCYRFIKLPQVFSMLPSEMFCSV